MPADRYPPPRDAASDRPADLRRALRQIAHVVAEVQQGRGLFHGHVELDAGTETVLRDRRLAPDSILVPDLMDPDVVAWGVTCAPSDRAQGEWTLTHAAGDPGRILRFVVFG